VLNARVLLLEGDAEAALREAEAALELAPGNREAVTLTALLTARAGDLDRSMQIIDEGIEAAAAGDIEPIRQSRVSILAEMGERERGLAELERLVADYPDRLSYQMALAELYLGNGRDAEAEALIRDLVARDPDNAQWRVRLANILVRQQRTADAEASLQQAVRERPDQMSLRLALASFYEQTGRTTEAVAVYNEVATLEPRTADGFAARNRIAALKVGTDDAAAREGVDEILTDAPDNADALLLRAALRIGDDDIAGAIADLRLVLVKRPTSKRALLGLARAQLLNGNESLAEEAYRRVLAVDPANTSATRELAVLVGNRGNTEEAETLLRQALRIEPDNPDASRNLVRALMIQQDFEAAEAEARRMVSQGGAAGVAEYQLGQALEAQQDVEGAAEAYREALDKAPLADVPLTSLTRLLVNNDREQEAEALLVDHLAAHPTHLQARYLLAEIYARRGNMAAAERMYRDVLQQQPEAAGAYIGLAGLYPPGSDERLAVLEEGAQAFPADAQLGLARGATLESRGDYEAAISAYEIALRANDNDVVANNLAALLLDYRSDAESHQRALELASRFEGRADRHPLNTALLGWAYYRNGDYAKATRYLEQAVAAAQQLPQLRYYLGMAYLKNGNRAGARQELAMAVDAAEASGAPFQGLDDAREALAAL
jgi:tetratricopeptide (TPR) repeat protein